MSIVPCKETDCQHKVQARGMCRTHYSYWQRANAKHELTCIICGESFVHNRKDRRTCSQVCHQALTLSTEGMQRRIATQVTNAAPKPALKTKEELQATWNAQRSAIRSAYEDGDWVSLLDAIKADTTLTSTGCWQWSRKSTANYPTVRMNGKSHQVHRLSLLAKHGKPLGVLAAHHKCANSMCVNPDHLQSVTHRENVAEMLARNSLEARIKELEDALHGVCPEHEALNRISVAA